MENLSITFFYVGKVFSGIRIVVLIIGVVASACSEDDKLEIPFPSFFMRVVIDVEVDSFFVSGGWTPLTLLSIKEDSDAVVCVISNKLGIKLLGSAVKCSYRPNSFFTVAFMVKLVNASGLLVSARIFFKVAPRVADKRVNCCPSRMNFVRFME